jgi:DNA-binding HxlR family transcriptional regulator
MELQTLSNPQEVNCLSKYCPSQSVLDMIADRWTVLVAYALKLNGTMRYNELQTAVEGISQKMLTQTLRSLERNGLVKRTVYPVVPPHTEYNLTELGHSLDDVIVQMAIWSMQNMPEVLQARATYDARDNTLQRPSA